jgi:mannose-6-phosphate isomerase-like protein (cupin superfamily)
MKKKTRKKKYNFLIKKGISQPLQNIPYHMKAPLKRFLLQDDSTFPDIKKILPGSNYHIAVHMIKKLPKKVPEYVQYHSHKCDEINIILSESSKLTYEMWFEDEKYLVSSPSIVYIPKGIPHKMKAIKGKGIYVCIVMSKTYKSSLVKKR